MREILYTNSFQPITIIELTGEQLGFLRETGYVSIDVGLPQYTTCWDDQVAPNRDPVCVVTIFAERFCRGEQEHFMLFTRDHEAALRLPCRLLPGQISVVRRELLRTTPRELLERLCGWEGR